MEFGKIERRSIQRPLDHNSEGFGGLAAVYYDGTPATEARVAPGLIERFMPGAFRESYASGDEVLSLYDHDRAVLLGKRSNGMKLIEDERGISYWIPLDKSDPDHVRVHAKIVRGDVGGSSHTFVVTEARNQKFLRQSDGTYVREIHKAALLELGPTPLPVYQQSTAEARSIQSLDELIATAKAACIQPPDANEFELLLLS